MGAQRQCMVVHTLSSLCLDVSGQATTNRSPVIVWNCNGQANQQWSLPPDAQPPHRAHGAHPVQHDVQLGHALVVPVHGQRGGRLP